MSKYIWITGASGFTGKHLINHLRSTEPDLKIIGLVSKSSTQSGADETFSLDINDVRRITELADHYPPHRVLHLAASMPPKPETEMFQVSVQGTYSLLCGLRQSTSPNPRILVVGSAAEYLPNSTGYYSEDSPIGGLSPYGRSKSAQTMLATSAGAAFDIDIVVARPFNLIGPGLSRNLVIGEICAQIAEGKTELQLGNIDSERDFIDIRDAVAAYWMLIKGSECSGIYNVASGCVYSIRNVLEIASELVGRKLAVSVDEKRLKINDLDRSCAVTEKISMDFNWKTTTPLRKSIQEMIYTSELS